MKRLSLILLTLIYAQAYAMEPAPNSIIACVEQAKSMEEACEQATEFLKKTEPATRAITTERFLLACQKKFHRSMFEGGFSMGTPESLTIAEILKKRALELWQSKPTNLDYAEHVFNQEGDYSDSLPSLLYYGFSKASFSHQAHVPLYNKYVSFNVTASINPETLTAWVESGLLSDKQYAGILFGHLITFSRAEQFKRYLDGKLDYNVTRIYIPQPLHMTPLDYAMRLCALQIGQLTELDTVKMNKDRLVMIDMLRKAGAKSIYELQP